MNDGKLVKYYSTNLGLISMKITFFTAPTNKRKEKKYWELLEVHLKVLMVPFGTLCFSPDPQIVS